MSKSEQDLQKKKNTGKKRNTADYIYAPLVAVLACVSIFLLTWLILPRISDQPKRQSADRNEPSSAAVTEMLPGGSSAPEGTAASPADTTLTEQTGTSADISAASAETTVSSAAGTDSGSSAASTDVTALPADPNVMNPSLLIARNALLFKVGETENEVIFTRDADAKIYPASMTKMMTLITFLSIVPEEKLDDHVTMTQTVINAQKARGLLCAGFKANESCKIRDLIYAMMLPSGAEAAVMLAVTASGTEEAFVQQMNQKAAEMGLQQTHFVNCTGLHNENHYSTARDISRILLAAMENPFIKEVMSTRSCFTESTKQHPNGIKLLSTTLTRMVGNELEGMSVPLHVVGGKTGFTNPAGQCLASWATDAAGNTYVCIVAGSTAKEPLDAIGDTLTLYQLVSEQPGTIKRIQPKEANLPDYVH